MSMNGRADRVPDLTDEEEARIQAGIAADPDNPEWTAEDFARARPFAEVFPEMAAALAQDRAARDGTPPEPAPDVSLTLTVGRAVADHFRTGEPGWQERIGTVLRKAAGL